MTPNSFSRTVFWLWLNKYILHTGQMDWRRFIHLGSNILNKPCKNSSSSIPLHHENVKNIFKNKTIQSANKTLHAFFHCQQKDFFDKSSKCWIYCTLQPSGDCILPENKSKVKGKLKRIFKKTTFVFAPRAIQQRITVQKSNTTPSVLFPLSQINKKTVCSTFTFVEKSSLNQQTLGLSGVESVWRLELCKKPNPSFQYTSESTDLLL